jgi:hypothetical protein
MHLRTMDRPPYVVQTEFARQDLAHDAREHRRETAESVADAGSRPQ